MEEGLWSGKEVLKYSPSRYKNQFGIPPQVREFAEKEEEERTNKNTVLQRSLQVPKASLHREKYKTTHFDPRRNEHLAIPSDIPPMGSPEQQFETGPLTWKEFEKTVYRARTASAPGPNGVPNKLYKNTPDL